MYAMWKYAYIRIRNMDYNKKKQEARIETAEMKLLRSVAGYTREDEIRNTKIR
jgi:hypothetical protein